MPPGGNVGRPSSSEDGSGPAPGGIVGATFALRLSAGAGGGMAAGGGIVGAAFAGGAMGSAAGIEGTAGARGTMGAGGIVGAALPSRADEEAAGAD